METTPTEEKILDHLLDSMISGKLDSITNEKLIDNLTGIVRYTIKKESNNISKKNGKCIICWRNPISHIFIPCGHYCLCIECSDRISSMVVQRCPLCREHGRSHKVYVSTQESGENT